MPRESDLSKSVGEFLQIMMNTGKVIWHDRLNSGGMMAAYGKRRYFMHLCRKGTPDRYAILKDGSMLWLEIKPPGGTVEPEQLAFHNMIQSLPNHQHLFVRSVEDVRKIFGHQSVGCV